ncbi:MAG: PP2C family protein-serine/threonine phosphatase, partial [Oceanipulchritudo sp.]
MGLAVGAGIGWFFWWTARREIVRLDEQRQMLAQEKLIVFDFVHNMVEAIGEGVTRQELFERVVHAAILSTGALSACIFERTGDQLRGVAVEGLFPPHRPLPESSRVKITTRTKFVEQILKSEIFKVGEGLVGTAARTGQGILIENALEDPRVIKHDDPSLEVRSVIVVPIRFRDRNLGVLAIVNPSDGGSFGETDFSLAVSLAEQAGLAIHNLDLRATQIEKNKLDVDLGLAHEIQNMLLPKEFPQHPALQMASIYKPAQKVGGDLYDIFSTGSGKIEIAIADVSGKG